MPKTITQYKKKTKTTPLPPSTRKERGARQAFLEGIPQWNVPAAKKSERECNREMIREEREPQALIMARLHRSKPKTIKADVTPTSKPIIPIGKREIINGTLYQLTRQTRAGKTKTGWSRVLSDSQGRETVGRFIEIPYTE